MQAHAAEWIINGLQQCSGGCLPVVDDNVGDGRDACLFQRCHQLLQCTWHYTRSHLHSCCGTVHLTHNVVCVPDTYYVQGPMTNHTLAYMHVTDYTQQLQQNYLMPGVRKSGPTEDLHIAVETLVQH